MNTDLGFVPQKRDKGTLRGYLLYDIVRKEAHKGLLIDCKEFIKRYYQELTYKELISTIKTLYNIILNQNEIKNLITSMNLEPKQYEASVNKFVRKEFPYRVSRGLHLEYFDYNTLEKVKLRPYD